MSVPPEGKDLEDERVLQWKILNEGKLSDDPRKHRRKFWISLKLLTAEWDRETNGPYNYLVERRGAANTEESDGCQVKQLCEDRVKCKCTTLLALDHDAPQYKLHPRLARLLEVHLKSSPVIIEYLRENVRTHKLHDHEERDYLNCGKY